MYETQNPLQHPQPPKLPSAVPRLEAVTVWILRTATLATNNRTKQALKDKGFIPQENMDTENSVMCLAS